MHDRRLRDVTELHHKPRGLRKRPAREWHSCGRKIRHVTKPPANERVEPYKCPYCEGWHMTSKAAAREEGAVG